MIKRFALLSCLFLVMLQTQAQFDTAFVKKNIRSCADSMMHGFRTRNWDLFTRYTYPAIVGSMGGAKEYSLYVGRMFSQMPDSAWKKYHPGKVLQVVRSGRDLQAVIELNSILEWQGTRLTSTSYLIGESWDNGLFWTFFDSQGDAESSRQVNANLSPDLVIPKTQEKSEPLTKAPALKKAN